MCLFHLPGRISRTFFILLSRPETKKIEYLIKGISVYARKFSLNARVYTAIYGTEFPGRTKMLPISRVHNINGGKRNNNNNNIIRVIILYIDINVGNCGEKCKFRRVLREWNIQLKNTCAKNAVILIIPTCYYMVILNLYDVFFFVHRLIEINLENITE